jgi:hypothetical protein
MVGLLMIDRLLAADKARLPRNEETFCECNLVPMFESDEQVVACPLSACIQ